MRLIALTSDVALQLGLGSLEPELLVVYAGAPEDAPADADVALIDLGSTMRGLAVVADLRARGIDMPCVVVGEADTGDDPTTMPLLRPFTLDEMKDALLALGTPYVRARGGALPGADVLLDDDAPPAASPAKLGRRERKELERAERAAAAERAALERQQERAERDRREREAREERQRAEQVVREERERLARLAREEQQRAEEQARLERERAEQAAREERERAAEAARLEKAARAQRERAEQAAREAEAATRRERERAEEAVRREREREDAARRELAAIAAREDVAVAPVEATPDLAVDDQESKRARKERQRAERALREVEAAREERQRAEQAAREEQQRAEEAARAAEAARLERERVERLREEHERSAQAAREERERIEQAAREERARLEAAAREERERAEQAAREERARAVEAARLERLAREVRERADQSAREEQQRRERAERAAREHQQRLEREERERAVRVEKARQAALARAEDMARREAAQLAAQKQQAAIRARQVAPRPPEPRRPVSPPSSFIIPSRAPLPASNGGADLVASRERASERKRSRLSDITGRNFRARSIEHEAPSPSGEMTRRVETALRAGTEIETILGMLPGLETPVTTADAFLSELREALPLTTAAIYGRDGDLFVILAAHGVTNVERSGTVTADHSLFREVIGGSGVLIDPVDLARGLVAGVAGATATVLMAAPLWAEDRCHGVVVVGGDAFDDEMLRKLCTLAERAAPSLALSQLIDGLRSALT